MKIRDIIFKGRTVVIGLTKVANRNVTDVTEG